MPGASGPTDVEAAGRSGGGHARGAASSGGGSQAGPRPVRVVLMLVLGVCVVMATSWGFSCENRQAHLLTPQHFEADAESPSAEASSSHGRATEAAGIAPAPHDCSSEVARAVAKARAEGAAARAAEPAASAPSEACAPCEAAPCKAVPCEAVPCEPAASASSAAEAAAPAADSASAPAPAPAPAAGASASAGPTMSEFWASWETESEALFQADGGHKVVDMGGVFSAMDSILWLAQAVRRPGVTNYCETGMNGGHSALAVMLANPNLNVYAIDNYALGYTAKAAAHLSKRFGSRFHPWKADVLAAAKTWESKFPGVKCDVFFHDAHSHGSEAASLDLFGQHAMSPDNVIMYRMRPKYLQPDFFSHTLYNDLMKRGVLHSMGVYLSPRMTADGKRLGLTGTLMYLFHYGSSPALPAPLGFAGVGF